MNRWKRLAAKGFGTGGVALTPPVDLPKTSRSFDRNDFVEGYMTVLGVLEFKLLHSLAQMDTSAMVDFQRRVFLLHQR